MAKKWKILLLVLVLSTLLSGCNMPTLDQLYCIPKRHSTDSNLQEVIDEKMGDLQYCAPISGNNQQTVQSADLDGDGKAEEVNPEGEDILLIRDGKAYALAEPLAKGQKLTAQDGVFIVKNAEGESRIYSRLRNDGIWPAG